jgi:hypothetical protein
VGPPKFLNIKFALLAECSLFILEMGSLGRFGTYEYSRIKKSISLGSPMKKLFQNENANSYLLF